MWLYNERHHGKGPIDGVGGTVKNVTFRKVKSSQVVICSPQGFSEAVKTFVPAIYAVYLPESEKIIEPKGIESSRKSNETLKIHKLERKVHPNGNTYINFYKIADDEEPFHVKWYGSEDDEICGHERSSNNENQCPKCNGFYKEGEKWFVAQCAKIGITKNVSISDYYFIFFINFT